MIAFGAAATNAMSMGGGRWAARTMALVFLASVSGDDPTQPHMHQGVFRRLKIGPPKNAGLKPPSAKLLTEKVGAVIPLKVSAQSPKGSMRCTSIQDVRVPASAVWDLLLDFPNYPRFVKGINTCKPYSRRRTVTGGKIVNAKYTVNVGPAFKINYYLEHQYEPLKNCMTWHLDYSRRSDLFDSVGYWYVEPRGPELSRVYYTTDSLLPSWIPTPVRKAATRIAMQAATAQLEPACQEVMRRGGKRPMWMPQMPQLQLQLPKLPQIQMPQLGSA